MRVAVAGLLAIVLISVEQEIEVGRETDRQVRKELRELKNAEVASYVRTVGARLVRTAPGARVPYSFTVADHRELNAFALPGGPVWVHRGLLQAASNESQLAGVLAHEIAHIAQRHAANRLSNAMVARMGLGLLGALLGNSGGAIAAQGAASIMAGGMFLKFSRDDEREADRVGLEVMMTAGWDGRGMIELFEILRVAQSRDPSSVEVFLSSHPSPQNRMADLRARLPRTNRGTRNTRQFQRVAARLRALPPALPLPRK